MVEAGDEGKGTQKPPSAEDLVRAEHYAAMMEAIARDDDDDFELDDADLDDHEFADISREKMFL